MGKLKGKDLTSAAVIVMSSVIVSRITGFIREMLIPTKFGVGEIGDIYNIAFLVPDLMYTLLVGGAVSAALIPVLSGYLGRGEEEEGWKAIGTFINVTFIATLVACLIGIIFTPQLIKIVAAGYYHKLEQVQIELVIKLTRILFPSVAFLMLAGLCNGVLNSYQRFAAASFGPSIYNLLSAASIFFLSNKNIEDNYGVTKVVIGVMLSAIGYFIFQLLFTLKNLKEYRPKIFLKHSGFRKLFKLAIPSLLSSSIMQINSIVSARFATFFDQGSVTALRMADRTWQMPLGIIAQGMGIAMLPSLSSKYATGDVSEYKNTLMKGLKTVLLLSIPSAMGIAVLNKPIIRAIFKFSEKVSEVDINSTANILVFFAMALIFQSINTILNRGFYAINDTKTPLYIGTSTIIVNILLSMFFLKNTNLGVSGMALAYSIASFVNAIILLFTLNKKVKGINISNLLLFIIKVFFASIIMGISLIFINRVFVNSDNILGLNLAAKLTQIFILICEITIGAFIYFSINMVLKVEETLYIVKTIKNKINGMTKK